MSYEVVSQLSEEGLGVWDSREIISKNPLITEICFSDTNFGIINTIFIQNYIKLTHYDEKYFYKYRLDYFLYYLLLKNFKNGLNIFSLESYSKNVCVGNYYKYYENICTYSNIVTFTYIF